MYLILDTDVLTILQEEKQPACGRLLERLRTQPADSICTTVVSFQEQRAGLDGSVESSAFGDPHRSCLCQVRNGFALLSVRQSCWRSTTQPKDASTICASNGYASTQWTYASLPSHWQQGRNSLAATCATFGKFPACGQRIGRHSCHLHAWISAALKACFWFSFSPAPPDPGNL